MNSGSPRLLVIPNADLQMENQEPGSYLDQLLTFRKKKSPLEKAKIVILDIGRMVKKVKSTIIFFYASPLVLLHVIHNIMRNTLVIELLFQCAVENCTLVVLHSYPDEDCIIAVKIVGIMLIISIIVRNNTR